MHDLDDTMTSDASQLPTTSSLEAGSPYRPTGAKIAIALQGGGTHAAFAAGALAGLLHNTGLRQELVGLTGSSGGAHAAAIAWAWLHDPTCNGTVLGARLWQFWDSMSAYPTDPFDAGANLLTRLLSASSVKFQSTPYDFPNVLWAKYGQDRIRAALGAALPPGGLHGAGRHGGKPLLFIGAAEILTGLGRAIPGQLASIEHLLASATLPEIYPAHRVMEGNHWDGTYWDGLFATNPPIAALLDVPTAHLPDEIWVVRINPKTRTRTPMTWAEIADRQNELAGNLSLEQEINQLARINKLLRGGQCRQPLTHHNGKRFYKEVVARELWLEEDHIDSALTLASKFDRSPDFIRQLYGHGLAQAGAFLSNLPVPVA